MRTSLILKTGRQPLNLILRSARRARLEGWWQAPASLAILRDATLRVAPQDEED
jgi:hypothetical protein